jgi:hypothetical protein
MDIVIVGVRVWWSSGCSVSSRFAGNALSDPVLSRAHTADLLVLKAQSSTVTNGRVLIYDHFSTDII